jgi:hypothetical protein
LEYVSVALAETENDEYALEVSEDVHTDELLSEDDTIEEDVVEDITEDVLLDVIFLFGGTLSWALGRVFVHLSQLVLPARSVWMDWNILRELVDLVNAQQRKSHISTCEILEKG